MTASRNRVRPEFHVYVVELDRHALGTTLPCVYVGETALAPAIRLEKHRAGGRTASSVVAQHGLRLRADLAAGWGPYESRQAAVNAEAALARTLRGRGYRVHGGQGYSFRVVPSGRRQPERPIRLAKTSASARKALSETADVHTAPRIPSQTCNDHSGARS